MLLFETILETFERERNSLDAQQMFYVLRGSLIGYCLDHEMDVADCEQMFLPDIKGLVNQIERGQKETFITEMGKRIDTIRYRPSARLLKQRLAEKASVTNQMVIPYWAIIDEIEYQYLGPAVLSYPFYLNLPDGRYYWKTNPDGGFGPVHDVVGTPIIYKATIYRGKR